MLLEEYKKIVNSIAMINEDEEIPVESPEVEPEENSTKSSSREAVRQAIEPQVDVANSIISSIKDAFEDNCGRTKKIANMEDQVKNWEKQIRGACQQIVSIVQNKNFMIDKSVCSPRAFKKINHSDSRDLSSLDLCAAIIVFYNSLG